MDVDISSELVNIVLPAAAVNQLHVQRVMVIFIVRQFTNGGPSLGASKSLVPHQAAGDLFCRFAATASTLLRGKLAGGPGDENINAWKYIDPKPAPGRQRLPVIDLEGRTMLKGLPLPELRKWCMANGFSASRAEHLWRLMYSSENGNVGSWAEARDNNLIGKAAAADLEGIARLDGGLELVKTHKALDGTLKMVFRADSSHSSVPCCASPEPKGSVHPQLQQRVKSVGSGVGGFSSSAKERGGNKSPQDAIVVPALQPEPVVGRAAGMIEAVLIPMGPQGERLTLCVSSQTGCAMNCKFCLTGRLGYMSDLSTSQIVEQVLAARRILRSAPGDGSAADPKRRQISNIVFMGMGEPLANLPAVAPALDILTSQPGLQISPARVTVSTSGLVPQMRQLAASHPGVQIAVSLNATTDEVRSQIMPVNRRWPLEALTRALREAFPADESLTARLQRRTTVFLEYIMLRGVNDTLEDAARLIELTQGIAAKINLIQFNPHEGTEFRGSDEATIGSFKEALVAAGCFVTVRHSKGDDAMAACGQLGLEQLKRVAVQQAVV